MKSKESEAFEAKYGYKATPIPVAIDAIVFVHKDNRIKGLMLTKLMPFFTTRKCIGTKDIVTWGDAGVKGSFSLNRYNYTDETQLSGTYGYFRKSSL